MTREELEEIIYERTRDFAEVRVMDCILELIAAEREACAKICDGEATLYYSAQRCATKIRARGCQK
jgi:hypothetical protein